MKKIAGSIGVAVSIFFLGGCGSTAHIQKDDSYNFNNIRSYAWVSGTQKAKGVSEPKNHSRDLTENKIHASVDKNLQANGWKETERNPDVLLVYDVDVQREDRNVSNPVYSQPMTRYFYNPYARRYVPVYYPSQFLGYDNTTETVKEGTITLSMIDADSDKTIWQGWATTEVSGRNLSDREINSNVKAILKKLDK